MYSWTSYGHLCARFDSLGVPFWEPSKTTSRYSRHRHGSKVTPACEPEPASLDPLRRLACLWRASRGVVLDVAYAKHSRTVRKYRARNCVVERALLQVLELGKVLGQVASCPIRNCRTFAPDLGLRRARDRTRNGLRAAITWFRNDRSSPGGGSTGPRALRN